ncbi:coatomer zeta-2 [Cyclospora cayetanensis]|uniref:Coatomer subunit zeta n=1 Tax=Cyclospora cayetanensis TaxID=88456 RepID=A0A1D3CUM4_9EIME|nr:coatomer zeta-2 [Cyclospora cayetanensis]
MESPLRLTCLLVLDADGERICVHYPQIPPALGPQGPYVDFEAQRRLEGLLHQSLLKIRGMTEADALQAEGEVAVGLPVGDVFLFAVSPEASANELLLLEVVEALRSVLASLCSGTISRQALIDNLDSVMLALDQILDQGLLLETNPSAILARVHMQGDAQGTSESASFNQASAHSPPLFPPVSLSTL